MVAMEQPTPKTFRFVRTSIEDCGRKRVALEWISTFLDPLLFCSALKRSVGGGYSASVGYIWGAGRTLTADECSSLY